MRTALFALSFFASSAPLATVAESRPTPSAGDVARLRAEVDALAQRLEAERRRTQDVLASLRTERGELARQLRLEEIRTATLERIADEHRARADGLEGKSRERLEPVRRAVAAAKAYVNATLPFKREERLEALERIERSLTSAHPDPSAGLSRLWRFVEEEEALAREVGLFQQPILRNGRRELVDVARVGMALLYYRAADGELGRARPQGGDWTFEPVTDGAAFEAVAALFAALDDNRALGPQSLWLWERPL